LLDSLLQESSKLRPEFVLLEVVCETRMPEWFSLTHVTTSSQYLCTKTRTKEGCATHESGVVARAGPTYLCTTSILTA